MIDKALEIALFILIITAALSLFAMVACGVIGMIKSLKDYIQGDEQK